MARTLNKGDRVSWASGRGRSRGRIERVITSRVKLGARTVAGSASDPRYLVRDERSGATAIRSAGSLRPLGSGAPARRRPPPTPSPPPHTARRRLDRRVAVGVLVGVLVTALALGYFVALPQRLGDGYRDDAGPSFERVDEAMYEVYESFRDDYFRGLAIEDLTKKRVEEDLGRLRSAFRKQYRHDRNSIERASKAVEVAKAAIADADADLTEAASPPLLGGIGELADARDHADRAEAYLEDAAEYLPTYEELLDYTRETVELEEEITAAILDNAPGPGASLGTYRSATGRTVSQLRKAKADFEELADPPESAEAFHFATDEGLQLSLEYFRQVQTGLDRLDIPLLERADAELARELRRFGLGILIRFGELQDESELSDGIEELEVAEDELADRLGAEAGPESVAPPLIPVDKRGETSET